MGNVDDISQLCRLCLVKDQVNIPIFEETSDIGQTFLKINSCLPVKVSRDDNLPKKICDGCSYKLDMLYTFRNTSADSEKQLISWLNQAGLGTITQTSLKDPLANTKPEITVKQETFDTTDNRTENDNQEMGVDATYLIQQQLPYEQEFEFGEPSGSGDEMPEEPAPKRTKRAAALKKAPLEETDDGEDDLERAMQITKAEDEDSEDVDQPDYVEAPSTSADDQPGPSGVGKTAVEAPLTSELLSIPMIYTSSHPHPQIVQFTFVAVDGGLSDTEPERTTINLNSNTIEENLICRLCGTLFDISSKQAYKDHLCIQKHTLFMPPFYPPKKRQERKRDSKEHIVKIFTCKLCEKEFSSKSDLQGHNDMTHKNIRDVLCEICGKRLKYTNLTAHNRTQHQNPDNPFKVKCKFCKKIFTSTGGLRTHIRVIHEGKRHLCETCGKDFSSPGSLQCHVRIHTGEKPFSCKYCRKAFTRKVAMKVHERVHTKEKPHVCEFCGNRYTQRSPLKLHLRAVHSKERPYACSVCPKKFVSRSLLNTHTKMHVNKGV